MAIKLKISWQLWVILGVIFFLAFKLTITSDWFAPNIHKITPFFDDDSILQPSESDEITITFWGATGFVSGSCNEISVGEERILVECGSYMNEQLPSERDSYGISDDVFPFDPKTISAVLITHNHVDHIGRIHYLVDKGFEGKIYMTEVTAALYKTILDDTISFSNIKQARQDYVKNYLRENIETVSYNQNKRVSRSFSATFVDAGHIPGSASIIIDINKDENDSSPNNQKTIVYSGDIGSGHHIFLDPPDIKSLANSDPSTLIIESTYGGLAREGIDKPLKRYEEFYNTINSGLDKKDLVVIPAFAQDRIQVILAVIAMGQKEGILRKNLNVVVGGKSSCQFTHTYLNFLDEKQYGEYFSNNFYLQRYLSPQFWTYTRGVNCENRELDEDYDFKDSYDIVVTPSADGASSLSRTLIDKYADDLDVLFIRVGWVPPESPMGLLSDAPNTKNISGVFSGHADQNGLIQYTESMPNLKTIIINHGEQLASETLKKQLLRQIPDVDIKIPLQIGEKVFVPF